MKEKMNQLIRIRRTNERGFTLLEYCAGAAIIAGVIWVALSAFGASLSGMFASLGQWATDRQSDITVQAPE